MVSIDTLRADRLGAYGHDRPTSPRLDGLAAEGVLFANAFSHSSKTAPSHMTLMTGLYPEAHRVANVFSNSRRSDSRSLSPEIPLLAEILRDAGYSAAASVSGGNIRGEIGFSRGFDAYAEHPMRDAVGLFRAGVAQLDDLARGDEPFFLFIHTYQVHAPYFSPQRYRERFVDPAYAGEIIGDRGELQRRSGGSYRRIHEEFFRRVDREDERDARHLLDLYDACIRYTDDQLGALLDRIDALGLADDTVVIVLSDHGEEFGEHGRFEHDALWEELLRIPLVLRVPERIRPGWSGRRVENVVGLVDVLPTLLELLDLPVPSHLQGQSLVAVVDGEAPTRPWLFAQDRDPGGASLRDGDGKLVRNHRGEAWQLFNLARDPAERHDESTLRPDRKRAAARRIARIIADSRAYWPLAGEGEPLAPDSELQEQLKALGYVDDSVPEPAPTSR
jgi:arylsulfatase A-like enzyme